jgi:hypothetical protein
VFDPVSLLHWYTNREDTTVHDLDKPVLNEAELFHYLHYDVGLTAVTRNSIKWAIRRREIQPTRFGNRNLFSKRDGLNWVESRKQAGPYEPTDPYVNRQPARAV